MININDLSTENRRFINSMPKDFEFAIPIKLINDTYYPINHEKLFLRYYVSYSGYVYDALVQKTRKYLIGESIDFYTTEDNKLIRLSLQEVLWRTFYRFPEGKDNELNSALDSKPTFVENKYEGNGYFINGVKFVHPIFPTNSKIYDELITKSKMKIAISENGAIYNIKSKYFMMIHLDGEGYPFIYSKSGIKIRVNELIAYSWYPEIYDVNKYSLMTTMCAEMFISKKNLLLYRFCENGNIEIGKTGHYLQNLALISYDQNEKIDLNTMEYYNIPINNFYQKLLISKIGTISNLFKKAILPFRIICDRTSLKIEDVYYKLPNSNKVFSIIDIYLWTVYRLTRSSVSVIHSSFVISPEGVPVIKDIIVVTKSPKQTIDGYDGFYIGNEWFPIMCDADNEYNNYYISKHGALFYTKSNTFIPYNLSTVNRTHMTSIPYENRESWIKIKDAIYYSWVGINLMSRNKIVSINGIPTDVSLFNLSIQNTGKAKKRFKRQINDNTLSQRSFNRLVDLTNSANNTLTENIIRNCGISDPRELALKVQIPEIII